jgi:hypothetical protein
MNVPHGRLVAYCFVTEDGNLMNIVSETGVMKML